MTDLRTAGVLASHRSKAYGLPARLWLDASDASTIVEASNVVSQWNDKSGNGFHHSQATASSRPLIGVNTQNGLNGITFDNTDDSLRRSDALGLTGNPDLTVFVVMRRHGVVDGGERVYSIGANGLNSGKKMVGYAPDSSFRYNDGFKEFANNSAPTTGASVLVFQRAAGSSYNGANVRLWDGLTEAVSTDSNNDNYTSINIQDTNSIIGAMNSGGDGSLNPINSTVFELIVCNAVPSDTLRNSAVSQLIAKWGIS